MSIKTYAWLSLVLINSYLRLSCLERCSCPIDVRFVIYPTVTKFFDSDVDAEMLWPDDGLPNLGHA